MNKSEYIAYFKGKYLENYRSWICHNLDTTAYRG